jgi:hypothetical protein
MAPPSQLADIAMLRWISSADVGRLWTIFAIESLLITLVNIPGDFSFHAMAFGDVGGNLASDYLLSRGYRPTIDFGYQYGLLALLVGRAWFGILGRTLIAYQIAGLICNLLLVWGIARTAVFLKVETVGRVLIIIGIPFTVVTAYPNFAHGLEAVLISHALAFHAKGRRFVALGLLTICCFVKPSMAYFYGALLLIGVGVIFFVKKPKELSELVRHLFPIALIAIATSVLLFGVFGIKPLVSTLMSSAGRAAYKVNNYGFWRAGHGFWHPAGVRLTYYLGTVTGFWILGTLFLCGFALVDGWQIIRRKHSTMSRELICYGAALHLIFIFLLFGNGWSWFYYFYVLLVGLAVSAGHSKLRATIVLALCFFLLLGYKTTLAATYKAWMLRRPNQEAAHLWLTRDESQEWSNVLSLTSGSPRVVFSAVGCADLILPDFEAPTSYYLIPGIPSKPEIERKANQIRASNMVIVPAYPTADFFLPWSELRDAMGQHRLMWHGHFFDVYQKF